jgi:S-DNA-T family DNA segregation ATPase FtsK/SpoIIIE
LASFAETPIVSRPLLVALARAAVRVAGVAGLAVALALALALGFHDPADPSWNQATAAAVTNPLGGVGAVVSDLLLQLFGFAAWLVPATVAAWALRLLLLAPHPRPLLPFTFLPLALLAVPAALADDAALVSAATTGLPGGLVGYELWTRFALALGGALYGLLATVAALGTTAVALGLRPMESLRGGRLASRLTARAAGWAGDRLQQGGTAAWRSARVLRRPAGVGPAAGGASGRLLAALRRRAVPHSAARAPTASQQAAGAARGAPPSARDAVGAEPPGRVGPEAPATASPLAASVASQTPVAPTPPPRFDKSPQPGPMREDGFQMPGLGLLAAVKPGARATPEERELERTSRELEKVLEDFGVRGQIVDAKPGPVITLFELEPAPGTRANRVVNLAEDIARSLSAVSVRVAVVRGRNVIGIELPNPVRETVYLRDVLGTATADNPKTKLGLALGRDISGNPVVADLARMPHLLIAGTTGSGKSVAINAMILSLLYKHSPESVRLILIDPKVIELSVYDGIPHLLSPVVTEPAKAVVALKWAVRQMDHRYRLMSHLGVRDIQAYNRRLKAAREAGEALTRRVQVGYDPSTGLPQFEEQPIDTTPLPQIVVVVDEVADLMLTAGKEVEAQIQRLSQKARAAGIHLIVATQRPSVDVLTGVIKANMPCRISFRVSSKVDSRTILGDSGAEQLLGQGDMLLVNASEPPQRVHGPLVSDAEVERVVSHLKAQGEPDYLPDVTSEEPSGTGAPAGQPAGQPGGDLFASNIETGDAEAQQYNEALKIVAEEQRATTSFLQRKMRIGYNTAARLIERMEEDGYVSAADHVGRRQILVGRESEEA